MAGKNRLGMWILAVTGALMLGGGFWWLRYDDAQVAEASHWPVVQGRVESAQVVTERRRRRRGSDTYRYVPRVEYSYRVNGTTYVDNHLWLTSSQSYSSHDAAAEVLRAYPVGGPVEVHYSPVDPRNSALRVEGNRTGAAVFIGIGLLLLGLAWWMRRKAQRAAMYVGAPPQGMAPPPLR